MEVFVIAVLLGLLVFVTLSLREKRKERIRARGQPEESYEILEGAAIHYDIYLMSLREKTVSIFIAGIFLFIIGYVFYQHLIPSLLLACLGILYPRIRAKELMRKRKSELTLQFKHALFSLSSALGAGKSVENAFVAAANDLKLLYPDPSTYIISELERINRWVQNGEPIEKALADLSRRAEIEDISSFTDVFITCKRSGGDLVEVIRSSSHIIGNKLDIQQEIAVLIAQKKFESKVLSLAPLFLVALLAYSSPDYMAPLYETPVGILVMTCSLMVLSGVFFLSQYMMRIKV